MSNESNSCDRDMNRHRHCLTTRVMHLTDIHFHVKPSSWSDYLGLIGKRLISCANLYLLGRRLEFSASVQQSLVAQVLKRHQPDIVVISGDFTAIASPAEFQLAADTLRPIFAHHYKTRTAFIIPGNHDKLTKDSERLSLFEKAFQPLVPYSLYDYPLHVTHRNVALIGMTPCRANAIFSHGQFPDSQLHGLSQLMSASSLHATQWRNRFRLVTSHYPIVDDQSRQYETVHPRHAVVNNAAFLSTLKQLHFKPHLFCHGHLHDGYQTEIKLSPDHTMRHVNPGSSGQSFKPDDGKHTKHSKRFAAYNLYTITTESSSELPDDDHDERSAAGDHHSTNIKSSTESKSIQEASHSPSSHNLVDSQDHDDDARAEDAHHSIVIERYVHDGSEFVKEDKLYTT